MQAAPQHVVLAAPKEAALRLGIDHLVALVAAHRRLREQLLDVHVRLVDHVLAVLLVVSQLLEVVFKLKIQDLFANGMTILLSSCLVPYIPLFAKKRTENNLEDLKFLLLCLASECL